MPIIQIDFLEGRTLEQKRAMVKKLTEAMCDTVNCPPEAVSIIIREFPKEHYGKAGVLACDK